MGPVRTIAILRVVHIRSIQIYWFRSSGAGEAVPESRWYLEPGALPWITCTPLSTLALRLVPSVVTSHGHLGSRIVGPYSCGCCQVICGILIQRTNEILKKTGNRIPTDSDHDHTVPWHIQRWYKHLKRKCQLANAGTSVK